MTPKIYGKNCLFSAFHPHIAGVFAQFDVRLRELNIARAKKWCLEDYLSFPFKQFSPFSPGHLLILGWVSMSSDTLINNSYSCQHPHHGAWSDFRVMNFLCSIRQNAWQCNGTMTPPIRSHESYRSSRDRFGKITCFFSGSFGRPS